MTHLIFNEFMGLAKNDTMRWINEGTAVYIETKVSPGSEAAYSRRLNNQVASNPIPFSQMANLAPQTDSGRNVDRWYAQVWSVVRFMILRGGTFNYSVFLGRLRSGDTADKAIATVYGGTWSGLDSLETSWRLYIQQ